MSTVVVAGVSTLLIAGRQRPRQPTRWVWAPPPTSRCSLGDAVALQAQDDLTTAYIDAAGRTPFTNLPAELGGTTLIPGVYRIGAAQLTGTLTLNAQGNPDSVFIFQVDSTLITGSDSSVEFINGSAACKVYWQVGSSATLGTDTSFVGTIMAQASVTMNTGADLEGRALARTAAVTLDTNVITEPLCAAPPPPPPPTSPPAPPGEGPGPDGSETEVDDLEPRRGPTSGSTFTYVGATLPNTGNGPWPLLAIGSGLLLGGVGLAALAARRRWPDAVHHLRRGGGAETRRAEDPGCGAASWPGCAGRTSTWPPGSWWSANNGSRSSTGWSSRTRKDRAAATGPVPHDSRSLTLP